MSGAALFISSGKLLPPVEPVFTGPATQSLRGEGKEDRDMWGTGRERERRVNSFNRKERERL